MLTLHLALTPTGNQVSVRVNGKESHQFSILELDSKLSNVQKQASGLQSFYKNPRPYGEKLFNALFKDGSPARTEFDALSKQSERTIVLVLESPELDSVAWEYAYNKTKEEYVVEDCAFVRALPEKERPANGRLKNEVERVPLLFIPANPLVDLSGEPMRALDVEGEWREMKRLIGKSAAPFDMIELRPATPEALQSVMARFQNGMIAHFSGHGATTRDGAILLFERENGASNPLEAREFVREIKDKAWIGFLSACQSAVPERTEFSNLARELAKAGVPFALGMQFNLPDPFAPNISGQFYNYLAHGHAVPEAARQARRAVKRENEFFVGMIALYAAHPDEVGTLRQSFDKLRMTAQGAWRGAGAQTVSLFRPADVSDLPSPASGLIGRQRELMRIGTRLLEDKKPLTVTLHGAGGIGKTALLWQALLRFAPSFELTLAIGLDPLPSLESVLGRVERFLGLPSPCANDTQEREALVRNALTSKRTLLGLDNFETLNYALNEKGSDEEKTAKSLHTFFKSLAANGVTLCVTSREVTNLPGETVEDIQGLTNESGGRLFQENVVRQKGEIYIEETQQVSEIVGGHPLALRLLASAFDDQVGTSLDQYIVSLQSFLPKARDKWTEEDRHESLRASFDFTMNNLIKTGAGKELQIALIRLSVFVAFFAPIVAAYTITNKWSETNDVEEQDENAEKISHALWERGLLERTTLTFEDGNIYLYRLHPVLGFFVKEQWTDAEIVKENYWKSMSTLANVAEKQITKSPFWAQVALRAIPDLILASESKIDAEAAHIQYQIAQLLQQFGRYDDSLQLLEKSRNTLGLFNQQRERAATIHATANIHLARGNLDEAMKLYQQLQEIYKGLGELLGEAIIINEMGKIYEIRGKLDVALGMYEQSLTIAQQLGDGTQTSAALHNIANIHTTRGNWDNAMKLYQQSLKIGNDLGELKHEATTLHSMANIHTMRGDWDDAMELYQQALRIQESLNDLQGKSITLTNMAQIYIRRGNLDEAMELYQLALRVQESLGDLRGKSATLHHMGLIFARRDDLDGAMKLYQQSLEINEGLGDLQGRSATLSQMSNIYWEKENYNEAKRLMEQSLQLFNQIGDIEGGAKAIAKLGQLCRARGDKKSALAYYQEALALLENLGAQPLVAEVRQLIASLESDTRVGKQQQGMTTEQFIAGAIQSAREKRPEAEDYFKSAQKMAADSNVPAEMRELGRVLQRIILGEKNVDLSSLPREWAEMVRKTVHE